MSCADLFLAFIAILFPPIAGKSRTNSHLASVNICLIHAPLLVFRTNTANLWLAAVWIKSGICTADSLINIALCCLGYLPGLLHAWYIIARNPEHDYDYEPIDNERGGERVTYYYVSHNQRGAGQQGQMNYGGTAPSQPKGQQQSGVISTAPGPNDSAAVGASSSSEQRVPGGDNAPPTYDDAVKGDHKVQTDN
jgi:uncharacterized membrane protein YqaE (UPF0057 family)